MEGMEKIVCDLARIYNKAGDGKRQSFGGINATVLSLNEALPILIFWKQTSPVVDGYKTAMPEPTQEASHVTSMQNNHCFVGVDDSLVWLCSDS